MTDFRALCVELTDCLEKADWPHNYKVVFQQWIDIAHAALAESDGPAVSDGGESDSVTHQLHRRATILLIRKVIDQAIRDTASVQWRVADTGEQLVRASDLVAWADHMEEQMRQLSD
jgi:hypothetical protein